MDSFKVVDKEIFKVLKKFHVKCKEQKCLNLEMGHSTLQPIVA